MIRFSLLRGPLKGIATSHFVLLAMTCILITAPLNDHLTYCLVGRAQRSKIITVPKTRTISGDSPQNAKSAAHQPRILQSIRGKENEKEENIEVNYLSLLYGSIVKKKSVYLLKEY